MLWVRTLDFLADERNHWRFYWWWAHKQRRCYECAPWTFWPTNAISSDELKDIVMNLGEQGQLSGGWRRGAKGKDPVWVTRSDMNKLSFSPVCKTCAWNSILGSIYDFNAMNKLATACSYEHGFEQTRFLKVKKSILGCIYEHRKDAKTRTRFRTI
jgi:hypothetical protein